jgi:hypothetical protein
MNRTFRHLLVPCLLAVVTTTAACELISTVDRSTIGGTSGTGGAGGVAASSTSGDMATAGTGGATAGTGGAAAGTGGATVGSTTATTGAGGAGGSGGATASSSSAGSTTASSSASTSVASSSSGGAMCVNPAVDCPAAGTCTVAICSGGLCSTMNVAGGTPAGPQVAGDCKQNVCNGAGSITSVNDDTDHTGDGEACTDDACLNGVPVHNPLPAGTDCTAEGPAPKHLCGTPGGAAAGKCIECNTGTDCTSKVCTTNACAAATCSDGVQNGTETGVDCGGSCPACMGGACFDGMKDGTETDIDCGGTCAANCGIGKGCFGDFDCASNDCALTGCIPAPTCSNSVQDGTETDKNCGGQGCNPCIVGLKCLVNSDCVSNSCNTGVTPHVCN